MGQRYFIKFSFDGRKFHGWQIQKNAISVQHFINNSLSAFSGFEVETIGCGRTDTGVHARNFYAHFDLPEKIKDKKEAIYKLNKILPFEISIMDIFETTPGAHARFDAISRTYRYYFHRFKDPFLNGYSTYHYGPLDLDLMQQAAVLLGNYRDFSSFSKSNTQVKTNLCIIKESYFINEGHRLIFHICADRFLRNMVRAIIGTMIQIGKHEVSLNDLSLILEQKDRKMAGPSFPPQGLYLESVDYPSEIFLS